VFLVHGEEPAIAGLATRLDGIVAARDVLQPRLDEGFVLTPDGAQSLERMTPPRLSPEKVAHLDWHNDVSRLLLEINEGLLASPDERTRAALIQRLQRALTDAERPS
jgi:metallo-beta-lactamase family protein